jgi:SET domain-containing protein
MRPALAIREVPGMGRCVFAGDSIPAGAIIAEDPVVALRADEVATLGATELGRYYFDWPGGGAIAFGPLSMMAHAHAPNAAFRPAVARRVMVVTALRDIRAGEQVTIDYGAPLPFTPKAE